MSAHEAETPTRRKKHHPLWKLGILKPEVFGAAPRWKVTPLVPDCTYCMCIYYTLDYLYALVLVRHLFISIWFLIMIKIDTN